MELKIENQQLTNRKTQEKYDCAKSWLQQSGKRLQELEDQLRQKCTQLDTQERLYSDKVNELNSKIENHLTRLNRMSAQIEESNKKEAILPEFMTSLRRKMDREVAQFKADMNKTTFALVNLLPKKDHSKYPARPKEELQLAKQSSEKCEVSQAKQVEAFQQRIDQLETALERQVQQSEVAEKAESVLRQQLEQMRDKIQVEQESLRETSKVKLIKAEQSQLPTLPMEEFLVPDPLQVARHRTPILPEKSRFSRNLIIAELQKDGAYVRLRNASLEYVSSVE
ncbi:hypothetical protein Ciccas_010129 [Cichlidogyrus casuarinus]|uniref:Uncharacterized protein n=1 Tax=Cichlidogyrus casuarinus TaxID=1844966 RepID=A0ABD2PXV6_9PLAT